MHSRPNSIGKASHRQRAKRGTPAWAKALALLFLGYFILTTYTAYGPSNFLWLSNIGLFGTVLALCTGSRLIASTMLVLTLLADGIAWTTDFVVGLATGWHPFYATGYMFDPTIPLRIRLMSLYHPVMAALLMSLVWRLGYDRRALRLATLIAWGVFVATYVFTSPERNVNWVFGVGTQPQTVVPSGVYLTALVVVVPLVLFAPVHWVLIALGFAADDGNR